MPPLFFSGERNMGWLLLCAFLLALYILLDD